jgi:hypothetical protein
MKVFTSLLPLLLVTSLFAVEPAPMPVAKDDKPQPAVAGVSTPIGFDKIVEAALTDAVRMPPQQAALTRYLSAAHLPPEDRRELYKVMSYHCNALSRGADIRPVRKVNDWLWAVQLDHFRWDAKVWENLKSVNFYFSIKVQQQNAVVKQVKKVVTEKVKKQRQVLRYDQYGRGYYVNEEYTEEVPREVLETVTEKGAAKEDFIPAPHLPQKTMNLLVQVTGSVTPIFRADAFLVQTGAQAERKGWGYYDFLGLTKRADAEKLAALDRKKAEEVFRELGAIIPVSGVSPQNRQVFRYSTLSGFWWESRDAFTSKDKQNAVANLLDDYKHDAEEIVATLPNGLPFFYLSDAKGVQVDTAPDTIASDHKSTNNDKRVHVGYSCLVCHQDAGLKPLKDYARKLYNPITGVSLATVALDPEKAERLQSVYLKPLDKWYKRDSGDLAEQVSFVSGYQGADLGKAYQKYWSRYLDEPITIETAAAECGVTVQEFRTKLLAYIKGKGVVDPVLVVFAIPDDDAPPVRREYWQERHPVVMLILNGANP